MLAVALSISAIFVVFLYVERGDPRSASLNISGFNVAAAAKLGLSPSDVAAADHRRYAAYVSQATWAALGAGLLCALAVFTKQSALAAPSAIFFFLALRDRRLALFFAVAFGGLSALFIIIFQPLTDGQFFTHVVSYNGQNFELDWLTTALGFLVGTHPVLLFFSLIYVYGEFRAINFTGVTTVFPGVWPLYFITALVTTFSAGKVGSNYNYYIELLFVASLLSWWFIARLLAIRPQLPLPIAKWKLPLAGTALLLMFIQLILLHHFPLVADGSDTPGPAQWQQGETVAAEVKRLGTLGPLLAEDSGWQAIANLPADLDDSFVFGQLAQDGQWNQQNFLKELRAGRYKNVMLQISAPDDTSEAALDQLVQSGAYAPFPGRFSPEMLSFIKQNYKPEKRFGHYLFLSLKS
jgi:hypothetical protein